MGYGAPGHFLLHRAILVKCCFDRNIGMWGVQIIATECPDHFTQLQHIFNHLLGENVEGPLKALFCPQKGPPKKVLDIFSNWMVQYEL